MENQFNQYEPSEGVITAEECLAKIVIPQTILWRPVIASDDKMELAPITFVNGTKENQCITKARLFPNNGILEPEIITYYNSREDCATILSENFGIVVIVDGIPPKNWTHLIVSRVSRALHSPGWRNPGAVIFCDVPEPYELGDYFKFRNDMGIAINNFDSSISWKDQVDAVENIWPDEERENTIRLIVSNDRRIVHGIECRDYCHLEDKVGSSVD